MGMSHALNYVACSVTWVWMLDDLASAHHFSHTHTHGHHHTPLF